MEVLQLQQEARRPPGKSRTFFFPFVRGGAIWAPIQGWGLQTRRVGTAEAATGNRERAYLPRAVLASAATTYRGLKMPSNKSKSRF